VIDFDELDFLPINNNLQRMISKLHNLSNNPLYPINNKVKNEYKMS